MSKKLTKGERWLKKLQNTPGFYWPEKTRGECYWEVCLEEGHYFSCKRQEDAEILSRLVNLEKKVDQIVDYILSKN